MGLNADGEVWDYGVHQEPETGCWRSRSPRSFWRVVAQVESEGLTSDEHFTVDGTLLEAWASQKSFEAKACKPAPPPG